MTNPYLPGGTDAFVGGADHRVVTSGGARGINLTMLDRYKPEPPQLSQPTSNELWVANGATITYQPAHRYRVTNGHWRKTYGPDCVTVNPRTGLMTFDTAQLPLAAGHRQDQSVHVGVELVNVAGVSEVVVIVHVGKAAADVHYVGPLRTHTTLVALATSGNFKAGDTVVVDSGTYTGLNNTLCFREGQLGSQLPGGSTTRYTNIMARIPGQWILDGQWSVYSAIYLYGNHLSSWDNTWVGSENHSWTMIQGLKTIRCAADSIGGSFVDHVIVRNCWPGDAAEYSGTHNVPNMSFTRSHDVVFEECAPYGYGRYNVSSYECDRVIFRRCMARHTPYWGGEPAASAYSFYRAQNCIAQNCWAVDSQLALTWMPRAQSPQYTTDAFQVASTGAYDYSHGNEFQRCGAVRVDTGFMHAASNALSAAQWCVDAHECVGHDFLIGSGKESQHGIMTGYKSRMYNSSMSKLRWLADTNADGVIIQGDQKQLYDTLFHDIGVDAAGAVISSLAFFSHWANVGATVRAERVAMGNFLGAKIGGAAVGYEATLTEVSPIILVGSVANGYQYLGRVEPGTAVDASGIGARNTLKNLGKLGTYYGDADVEAEAGSYTFPLPGHRVTQQIYNEYTYNEPLSGLPIFYGNYGLGADGEDIGYWVHSRLRASVFPLHVDAQAFVEDGTKVRISWLAHPAKYRGHYLGYKIYRDGGYIGVASFEETDFTDDSPVAVGTDVYTVVAMHASDGDSGHSHPCVARAA